MKLNEWILLGKEGASSRCLWGVFTDVINRWNRSRPEFQHLPMDSADFERCVWLCRDCNIPYHHPMDYDGGALCIENITLTLPWWKPFVSHWVELVELLDIDKSECNMLIDKLYREGQEIIREHNTNIPF